jgi:hypothetical protein
MVTTWTTTWARDAESRNRSLVDRERRPKEHGVKFEIVDGEAWQITPGKTAGVTPARPERRELLSRDPEFVRGLLDLSHEMETYRQARAVLPKVAERDRAVPLPRTRQPARAKAKVIAGCADEECQTEGIPRRSELPGWPRGLHERWAAAYVGLSPTSFRVVARDHGISAVWLTPRRKVYLREDLDAWLDRKAGRREQTVHNPWDDI